MSNKEIKKRGRPKKNAESSKGRTADFGSVNGGSSPSSATKPEVQEKIVEVIKEVVKLIPEPRLEGFDLYMALKNKGYPQGGMMGQWIEDPNGIERVYIPHTTEIYTYFLGNPEQWELIRDAMIRAYIELQ